MNPTNRWSGRLETLRAEGVTCITEDSRAVIPGSIFVAVGPPDAETVRLHLRQARDHGAWATVGSHPDCDWYTSDPRHRLAQLAAAYYQHPSTQLRVVGITGTSGKTTTAYLLRAIFERAGLRVGMIGTIQNVIGGKLIPATLTTPSAPALQEALAGMCEAGDQIAILEISSHALSQRRADEIAYDAMVFTNLSPEHLDYHLDLEDYYQAKKRLFTALWDQSRRLGKEPRLVIESQTSPWGNRLFREIRTSHADREQGGPDLRSFCTIEHCNLGAEGMQARFQIDELTVIEVESTLLGHFNALNISGALQTAVSLGVKPEIAAAAIREFPAVPGRLERVPLASGQRVWVDYAHKPAALNGLLETLGGIARQNRVRLVCVFGCGGDRDRSKRPLMGEIGARWADDLILTSDNPRSEDPQAIIEEILQGISTPRPQSKTLHVEVDRRLAIRYALQNAQLEDLIVIAGKGHEKVQIIGKELRAFDDVQVVREIAALLDSVE